MRAIQKRNFYIAAYIFGKFCGCLHKFLFLICKLNDMVYQEVKKKTKRNLKGLSAKKYI